MGKKLVILIVLIIIIVPIGILGADIALSISSYNPSDFSAAFDEPSLVLSEDNSSINYAVNVTLTTPQLGFLPKAIIVTLNIYQNGTLVGQPIIKSIALGNSQIETINGAISIDSILQLLISGGSSITFNVKGLLKLAIFGFTIPGIELPIPDQSFTVP